jgi:hypothetical protein
MKHGNVLFPCLLTTVTPELNPHIKENTRHQDNQIFIPLQKRRTSRTSGTSVEVCGYGWTHIIGRSLTDMCYKRLLFCRFSILCFLVLQLSNKSKQCNILNLKGRTKHFVLWQHCSVLITIFVLHTVVTHLTFVEWHHKTAKIGIIK